MPRLSRCFAAACRVNSPCKASSCPCIVPASQRVSDQHGMFSMPNDEHVALLKQGVPHWNAWRDKNPDIRPDLARANLQEANLAGADLRRANLQKAYLYGANLRQTLLTGATLHGANLQE